MGSKHTKTITPLQHPLIHSVVTLDVDNVLIKFVGFGKPAS